MDGPMQRAQNSTDNLLAKFLGLQTASSTCKAVCLQADFGDRLEEKFQSRFCNNCPCGSLGMQLGHSAKWGAQTKGRGLIRTALRRLRRLGQEDRHMRRTSSWRGCLRSSWKPPARVELGCIRKEARGLLQQAAALTKPVPDMRFDDLPLTSCWFD